MALLLTVAVAQLACNCTDHCVDVCRSHLLTCCWRDGTDCYCNMSPPEKPPCCANDSHALRAQAYVRSQPNICESNATIGRAVLAASTMSWPGLEDVAHQYAQGNLGAACAALASYYREGNSSAWLRIGPVTPGTKIAGGSADDLVLHDIFHLRVSRVRTRDLHWPARFVVLRWMVPHSPGGHSRHGVDQVAKIGRNADGGLDWLDKGPQADPEFMNCLNRHTAFSDLLGAWKATGNPVYPRGATTAH